MCARQCDSLQFHFPRRGYLLFAPNMFSSCGCRRNFAQLLINNSCIDFTSSFRQEFRVSTGNLPRYSSEYFVNDIQCVFIVPNLCGLAKTTCVTSWPLLLQQRNKQNADMPYFVWERGEESLQSVSERYRIADDVKCW